jgi:hypothetical protein
MRGIAVAIVAYLMPDAAVKMGVDRQPSLHHMTQCIKFYTELLKMMQRPR